MAKLITTTQNIQELIELTVHLKDKEIGQGICAFAHAGMKQVCSFMKDDCGKCRRYWLSNYRKSLEKKFIYADGNTVVDDPPTRPETISSKNLK